MTARCLNCSAHFWFRNQRGAKLSACKCSCGGKYELLSFAPPINVTLDLEIPEGITPDFNGSAPLGSLYPMKNRKGDLFVLDNQTRKYKPIKLPAA